MITSLGKLLWGYVYQQITQKQMQCSLYLGAIWAFLFLCHITRAEEYAPPVMSSS